MTEHERSTPDPSPQSPPERPLTVSAAEAEAVRTTVDAYVRQSKFRDELGALRGIILATGLEETLKWRAPCYMWERRNVVLVGAFRDHIILSFIKGALIPDTAEVLSPQGENSRSVRVMRFCTLGDCDVHETVEESDFGKFGWVMDPEGNKVELWEPPHNPAK